MPHIACQCQHDIPVAAGCSLGKNLDQRDPWGASMPVQPVLGRGAALETMPKSARTVVIAVTVESAGA
jgi:hypothetical protein